MTKKTFINDLKRRSEIIKAMRIYPFSILQNLDSSKMKESADDNFELDENGGKLSKR